MNHSFRKPHLIAIDSDGCAFDGMTIKHREAFIPEAIKTFKLEAHAELYQQTAEEINLFSEYRGVNRFIALYYALRLTQTRAKGSLSIPDLTDLVSFINDGTSLSNQALHQRISTAPSEILSLALEWSENTNQKVSKISSGIPVFPGVSDCLESASKHANLMICSAASTQTLTTEWDHAGLLQFMSLTAGQEYGSKSNHLKQAMKAGPFEPHHVLTVGDALGDLEAATASGASFFPITPGQEAESWELLNTTIVKQFINGTYDSKTQEHHINQLRSKLSKIDL